MAVKNLVPIRTAFLKIVFFFITIALWDVSAGLKKICL